MASNKDADEVVKFLALLAKLKDWCDDDPGRLRTLAESNDAIKGLCNQLSWAAHFLKMNERRHRELFAAPTNPKFMTEWRDFEARFESVLLDILFAEFFEGLEPAESTQASKADLQWEFADDMAREQASAIEEAIAFAHGQATQDWREFDEGFRENIEDGMAAWERLKSEVGFDLRGIFRRRDLIPFVLVRPEVAAGHGSTEAVSLLKNLREAHDAFIFGTPLAALGLMRSIMEATLRDHYKIGGEWLKLEQRIEKARPFLPSGVGTDALHSLRELSNTILHLREKDREIPGIERAWLKKEGPWLEKQIVWLLFVLRTLIEGEPRERF
jgi:hypothetical protein